MELLLFPAAATLLLLGAELLDAAFTPTRHRLLSDFGPLLQGDKRVGSAIPPSPELPIPYDRAA